MLTFRASPVWVMAALADVSGAGRQLIAEIAATLKQEGLLAAGRGSIAPSSRCSTDWSAPPDGLAETVNTPPLDIKALRQEWTDIRREVASIPAPNLPSPADVWESWRQLTAEAERQKRTVWELSSLMALGAVTRLPDNLRWLGKSAALATRRTGEIFAGALLDHYRQALAEIHETGYLRYMVREFRPYLKAAVSQFSPKHVSLTQRLLRRKTLLVVLCCLPAVPQLDAQQRARPVAPAKQLPRQPPVISPAALRAHVSFLAADAMQGRDTPSRELDIAAEYIASQFRRIGLEQPSPAGYFQVSESEMSVDTPSGKISILPSEISLPANATLAGASLTKVASAEGLKPESTRGRVILTRPETARHIYAQRETLQPALIVAVAAPNESDIDGVVTVRNGKLRELYESLPEGKTDTRINVVAPGLKNVIGVLPGTDPVLREQYVILSAHYDHVGARTGEGDGIYNGANDNASGVAGFIEAAAALTASPVKPRRTVLFIAFFGEEKGLVGARYYAAHPVFPIESTAANLNLEQLGRTDDSEGPRVAAAILTGFGFSETRRNSGSRDAQGRCEAGGSREERGSVLRVQ